MGTNYYQHCIVGISLKEDDLLKVISPAEYREEPRYNTKTGQQTHTEKVLVKEEDFVYEVFGKQYDDIRDVEIDGLDCLVEFTPDEIGDLFIGLKIGDDYDCGRVELLQGSYSLVELLEKAKEVSEKLGITSSDVGIHFVTYVG